MTTFKLAEGFGYEVEILLKLFCLNKTKTNACGTILHCEPVWNKKVKITSIFKMTHFYA